MTLSDIITYGWLIGFIPASALVGRWLGWEWQKLDKRIGTPWPGQSDNSYSRRYDSDDRVASIVLRSLLAIGMVVGWPLSIFIVPFFNHGARQYTEVEELRIIEAKWKAQQEKMIEPIIKEEGWDR